MKNKIVVLVSLASILLFSGCSHKSQINPDPNGYQKPPEEIAFDKKQEQYKREQALIKKGEAIGYAKAKIEFEKIIPYIEAIRASAELQSSGGLCLPPLFLDKSDKGSVKIVLGKAHVCENFTVDNVLKSVKSGIPGLPQFEKEQKTFKEDGDGFAFSPSGVEIEGDNGQKFFAESPSSKKTLSAKIKSSYTNRQVLRDSNMVFSNVALNEDTGYLMVDFKSESDLKEFCKQYRICD